MNGGVKMGDGFFETIKPTSRDVASMVVGGAATLFGYIHIPKYVDSYFERQRQRDRDMIREILKDYRIEHVKADES